MSAGTLAAAWDCRDPGWFSPEDRRLARTAWLADHGLAGRVIYRIEFSGGDPPSARLYCYEPDEQGRRHWAPGHVREPHDHSRCDVARREPFDVILAGLPPEELR